MELPRAADSLKFAVIGDNGTGQPPQYEVAQQMLSSRTSFPFTFVLMLGDNLYGSQKPQDFVEKFERPYAPLLDAGVRFYAALGNHDEPTNRSYPPFNMAGERYYTFAKAPVRFFVLDTNLMDRAQLAWAEDALARADEPWKIAYFHHPTLFRRRSPRLERRAARHAGTAPRAIRRGRRLLRTRAHLRTHDAAEGHHLLHRGLERATAQGRRHARQR